MLTPKTFLEAQINRLSQVCDANRRVLNMRPSKHLADYLRRCEAELTEARRNMVKIQFAGIQ